MNHTLPERVNPFPGAGLLLAFLALALSGCGTFGDIAKVPATIPDLATTNLECVPRLQSMEMAPDAARNQAVGAMNLGAFTAAELEVLRQSIVESLAGAQAGPDASRLGIHVYVHQYVLSFSNTEAGALAVVDWCATRGGTIVAGDLFYTSFYARNFPLPKETLGSVKNKVNKALVRHIVQSAMTLCGHPNRWADDPLVHADPQAATAVFPETLSSYFVGPVLVGTVSAATEVRGLTGEFRIDWPSRLGIPSAKQDAPNTK